jgi:hypothetical protein
VPTLLYSLQPQWTGCVAGIDAFFDPIYTLTTSGAMGLVQQTTTKGSVLTVAAETRSLSPGNSAKTTAPPPTSVPSPPSAFIVAGQTLSAGGHAITVAGSTYSLQAGGSSIVMDGTKTVPLANFLASPPGATGASVSGGSTPSIVNPNPNQDPNSSTRVVSGASGGNGIGYVFGSQTLQPGSQITVSGEVISLASDGSSVVIMQLAPTQTGSGGSNQGGSGAVTITDGISALINGGAISTQSGQKLKQTGTSEGARGRYTGHERMYWVLGALWGVWVGFEYLW